MKVLRCIAMIAASGLLAALLSPIVPASPVHANDPSVVQVAVPKGQAFYDGTTPYTVKVVRPGIGVALGYQGASDASSQLFVERVEEILTRLEESPSAKELIGRLGAFRPVGAAEGSVYLTPGGARSELNVIFFPRSFAHSAAPLSGEAASNGEGSAVRVELDDGSVGDFVELVPTLHGEPIVAEQAVIVGHELGHAEHELAGGLFPSKSTSNKGLFFVPDAQGTTWTAEEGRTGWTNFNEEAYTQGGHMGLVSAYSYETYGSFLPPNGWGEATVLPRNPKMAEAVTAAVKRAADLRAAGAPASQVADAELEAVVRENAAQAQFTEVKLADELGVPTREEYMTELNAKYDRLKGSRYELRVGYREWDLTTEDRLDPAGSSKLRLVDSQEVVDRNCAANFLACPFPDELTPLDDAKSAEVRKWSGNVKRAESPLSSAVIERLPSEALPEYGIVAGNRAVDSVRTGEVGFTEPVFAERIGAPGIEALGLSETSKEMSEGFKGRGLGTALGIAAAFQADSTLGVASAVLQEVPILGPMLLLADAAQRGDKVQIAAGALFLASSVLESAVSVGLVTGTLATVAAFAATVLGVVALAVAGVGILLALLPANDDNDYRTVPIPPLKDSDDWDSAYVEALLQNGFSEWSQAAIYQAMPEVAQTVEASFQQSVKAVISSAATAQAAAARVGELNGSSADDVSKAQKQIRDAAVPTLQKLRDAALAAADANLDKMTSTLNVDPVYTSFRTEYLKKLYPTYLDFKIGKDCADTTRVDGSYQRCADRVKATRTEAAFVAIFGTANPSPPAFPAHSSEYQTPFRAVLAGKGVTVSNEGVQKELVPPGPEFFRIPDVPAPAAPAPRSLPAQFLHPLNSAETTTGSVNELIRVINGYGKAGATYQVRDQDNTLVCTAQVYASGIWSCPLANPRTPGSTTSLTLWENGSRVGSAITLTAPKLAITAPAAGAAVDAGATTSWKGTAIPGHEITLTVFCTRPENGNTQIGHTVTADAAGTWSFTLTSADLVQKSECTLTAADKAVYAWAAVTVTTGTPASPPPGPINTDYEAETASSGGTVFTNGSFTGRKYTPDQTADFAVTVPDARSYTITIYYDSTSRGKNTSVGVYPNGSFIKSTSFTTGTARTKATVTLALNKGANTVSLVPPPGVTLPDIDAINITG